MVFSSILFLFKFLPVAFLIYYIAPYKIKNLVLFIASLIFYSWGERKYIVIMFASILIDYCCSNAIEKFRGKKLLEKLFLVLSICFNLGLLLFFKYTNFFVDNINALAGTQIAGISLTLPLGISFYTFQTMSYTIDVYRGKFSAEKNIIDFGAFVCMFPQLIAGPIVTYGDIRERLKKRTLNAPEIEKGIRLFIMGLGSKVLIANNIGMLWDDVSALGFANISTPLAWLCVIAFAFQIYFDFSGYSLMAIGLGHMLGFNFPQNFNYPYISKSVTEFWRRWHMTLGYWFREYVYIPLGGNRVGKTRLFFNLFLVWFLTGFWHGANWNFILWGLFYFALLMLEKSFLLDVLKKSKIISHVYLIFVVLVGWALFAVTDMAQLGQILAKMFSFNFFGDFVYFLRNYGVILVVATACSMPIMNKLYDKINHKKWLVTLLLTLILLASVAYLVDATYNPFLYFRF
ncbi:MAG: MBOAT family protein [Oscillospiraceae bacterium]|nr:MBOAT family protein [Oscillospiraceae bacterium]